MGLLWFCGALVALLILIWGIDVYRHRHPLELAEIIQLARKRQRNLALLKYRFSTFPQPADPVEKKAMKSQGEFVACNLSHHDAPARIAGLLKYRKHEWIVLAFIKSKQVTRLWWNKGPDGTRVWSVLGDDILRSVILSLKPDVIAILHNHPNSDPFRYRVNTPSDADLRSAGILSSQFSNYGTSLLEFVCERGIPHLYYARFDNSVVPLEPVVADIKEANGKGVFKNYSLRKDLKRTTRAEEVAGGDGV
jgi:hypothetical protein